MDEIDEQFLINLSNPENGLILDSQATLTITDDDEPPDLQIQYESQSENEGLLVINFDLSVVSGKQISFKISTGDGTAFADEDYIAVADQLITINSGVMHQSFNIALLDDALPENTEIFHLLFSDVQNIIIDETDLCVEILDDDIASSHFLYLPMLIRGN